MRSIKVALATVAVVGVTVSGAYAAGVVNKSGHEVNDHAAHGQSVAAAARAKHTTSETPSSDPSETTSTEPSDDPTTDPSETDSDTTEPSDSPSDADGTEASDSPSDSPSDTDKGKHLGQTKIHKHYGHAYGRDHGKGKPTTLPTHPTHPTHPAKH